MAVTIIPLSESNYGVPITMETSSKEIHTSVAGTTQLDEIFLYAINSGVSGLYLTLTIGNTGDPPDNLKAYVNSYPGCQLILPGIVLQNSAVISGKANASDGLSVLGYAQRGP